MHPIAYQSWKLTLAKIYYFVHKKEPMVIKLAICTYNYYIHNRKQSIILIDYESLKYLQSKKNPFKQLVQWVLKFAEYNLDIRYQKEKDAILRSVLNQQPDFIGNGLANKAEKL